MRDQETFRKRRAGFPKGVGAAAALWAAFQVAACDSPTSPKQDDPGLDRVQVTSVGDLLPGQASHIEGRNLDRMNSLSIDGIEVSFQPTSSARVWFTVPGMRSCETDAREVEVRVDDGITATGKARVVQTLALRVGESRILSSEDLECLQLSREGQAFALSAASHSPEREMADVLSFRALGVRGGLPNFLSTPSPVAAAFAHDADGHGHAHGHDVRAVSGVADPGLMNAAWDSLPRQVPFDDYAGARVGDVLKFVSFDDAEAYFAARTKEEVPTYEAKVLAISGNQMVVVDLRTPDVSQIDTPGVRSYLSEAASIADQVMLDALKQTIDPGLVFPEGAGGRVVHMVRPLSPGVAGSVISNDMSPGLPWTSNMFVTTLNTTQARTGGNPANVARIMVHEAAHLTDALRAYRSVPGAMNSTGWHSESIAVMVEDAAARLLRGQVTGATRETSPGTYLPATGRMPNRTAPTHITWGPQGGSLGSRGPGAYNEGARILRFLQEQHPPGEGWRAHDAVMQAAYRDMEENGTPEVSDIYRRWDIDHVAAANGFAREELLDQVALQNLAHDFVDHDVLRSEGISPIRGWAQDPGAAITDQYVGSGRALSSLSSYSKRDLVPSGAYAYWYINSHQGAGMSIEADHVSDDPNHRIRITRIR